MEKQVVVVDGVHATMLQKQAYVALQLLAHLERVAQTLGQHLLFGRKFQRIVGVYRWELVAGELVFLPIERDTPFEVVDVAQHDAVCHLPMGMLFKELCLSLNCITQWPVHNVP